MQINIKKIIRHQNTPFIFLSATWAIVEAALFWHFGIETGFEAEKYINEANYFLQYGKLTSNNFWLYSTQIFLIAAITKLHLGFFFVVLLQWLLNLFATWMFYKLAFFFFKSRLLSCLATFIFIINIPYQTFNSFLFTESIFYSLTVIYSSYLLRIKNLRVKNVVVLILMLGLLSVTRPTGILFAGATVVYFYFRFLFNLPVLYKIFLIGAALFIFFISIDQMLQTGGSLDFMLPFKKENIICGVNTTSAADIQIMEKGNSLRGLFYYLVHNRNQFLRLSKLKTIAFFGFIRSYFSSSHNAYLMIFFYPFYLLSIIGIIKMAGRKEKIIIYLLTIIFLYWITTLLTCDDWHNRFILTVTPFIFLIGFAAFTRTTAVSNTTFSNEKSR